MGIRFVEEGAERGEDKRVGEEGGECGVGLCDDGVGDVGECWIGGTGEGAGNVNDAEDGCCYEKQA